MWDTIFGPSPTLCDTYDGYGIGSSMFLQYENNHSYDLEVLIFYEGYNRYFLQFEPIGLMEARLGFLW